MIADILDALVALVLILGVLIVGIVLLGTVVIILLMVAAVLSNPRPETPVKNGGEQS